jgi:nitrite reductase/ring-hydroxylating ferredoxin subunit
MKKILYFLPVYFLLLACSGSDDNLRRNPNLPDLNFRFQLNLSLPEYNDLQFPGNSYTTYNHGVKGVVIYNLNNSQYLAFELSDPNHPPSNCSGMRVNGVIATCDCEGNQYNIITGELADGEGQYTMKPYRIQRSGNVIEVWN